MNPVTTDDKPREATVATILAEVLVRKARTIKTHRDLASISEAIERFGGPGIDDEYRRCVEEMQAELGGEAGA